ncbi:hypothetical protein PVAND_007007 [Polypedilum vanderplanki]|uniref:Uncharacterized protein n=1 Tax=Polypedilum vanderplanki TaxID=319348 RepID=A0A9J6C5H2_POLVA|nr:hypothetical protein PVAND_007007 [Polypedilum vanderplanki]
MAPHNSTLINLINDDIKSITSENLSSITAQELESLGNSDNESEQSECAEEIPIYINQVARYISGVNRRTTCNDIIKALIDDELANMNFSGTSKQLICEPQHYKLYERFQDIEHALDGEELIYEIWKNWGENRRDVQFRLKINRDYENEMRENEQEQQFRAKIKKIRKNGIKKLLKKVLHQGEMIQNQLKQLQDKKQKQQLTTFSHFCEQISENSEDEFVQYDSSLPTCSKWTNNEISTDTEDELFLVIENHNDNDSGVFITKEQQAFFEMDIDCSTPKRKFRFSCDFESIKNHAINSIHSSENFARTSCKFEKIHKDLKSKMNNVKEMIDQEQSFLTKINRINSLDVIDFDNTNDKTFTNNISEFCDNNNSTVIL